jgi:hypothetical protein
MVTMVNGKVAKAYMEVSDIIKKHDLLAKNEK